MGRTPPRRGLRPPEEDEDFDFPPEAVGEDLLVGLITCENQIIRLNNVVARDNTLSLNYSNGGLQTVRLLR